MGAVEITFKGQLPTVYTIQYVDTDGDKVMIQNDEDYKAMFQAAPKGSKSIKVYITAIDESEVSFRKDNSEIMSKSDFSEQYSVFKPEEKASEINSSEKTETKDSSLSQFSNDDKVKEMVESALLNSIPSISLLVKDFLAEGIPQQPKKVEEPKNFVHHRIICDNCGMNPIVGVRYKCAISEDYDLCEKCEAKVNHPYPMLKIKDPKYHPVQLTYVFNEDFNSFNPKPKVEEKMPSFYDFTAENFAKLNKDARSNITKIFKGIPEKLEQAINHLKPEQPKKVEEPAFNFQFVKEISTIPSKISVKDLVIYKTITIKNTGKTEWPKKTYLVPSNEIAGQKANLIPLGPNKEMSAVLIIDSPREAGQYVSIWKMAHQKDGKEVFFGEPICLEFEIAGPKKESQVVYAPIKKEEKPKKTVVFDETPKPVEKKPVNSNETPMGYSDEIVKKVKQMKEIFNDADVTFLLDYVKNSADLEAEELIEGYLAMLESEPKVEEPKKVEKKVEETPRGDERETPRGETPKGFSEEVVKKVKTLKELFAEADVAVLLDFVNSSGDMTTEELIDSYLEICEENSAFFDAKKEVVEEKKPEPKYSEKVLEKAKQMKEILSETDMDELCQFITNAPEAWTLNELIESYLQ